MSGETLSPDDARILGLESPVVAGHTLKLLVLEPGEPVDLLALRVAVAARLAGETRATERVDLTDPAGPRWVAAEGFDIGRHVRRLAAAPDEAAAWSLVGGLMAEHLDRDRPLWTIDLIGPLDDGRELVATRMHHAMVDGIAGMAFLEAILLDAAGPDAASRRDEAGVGLAVVGGAADAVIVGVDGSVTDEEVVVADIVSEPATPGADIVSEPATPGIRPATTIPHEWLRAPAALARELGHPAGASPFDLPLTRDRELAFVSLPLGGLREIGGSRAAHATVNDVLLAVIAGGLHAWLHGHDAGRRLRAQVPVSLHHRSAPDGAQEQGGNHDSFLDVDLPLGEPDPLRRLDRISAQTRLEKSRDDAAVLYDLFHALGRVGAGIARAGESPREFAVSISNVPGPRRTLSVAGRRVEHLYSSSEPGPRHALRISAISHGDELGVGLCTDPTAVHDLAGLAAAVGDAYRDLHHRALGAA